MAESLAPGAVVREVARRADVCPGQIYRWRRDCGLRRTASPRCWSRRQGMAPRCVPAAPAIEIEFAGKARVRIPASIPAGLAAAVVKALSRR